MSELYGYEETGHKPEAKSHLVFDYLTDDAPEEPFSEEMRVKKVKYLMLFMAQFCLQASFGGQYNLASVLMNPPAAKISEHSQKEAALIRKHVIRPLFGTVANFWTQFVLHQAQVRKYGFDLHPDEKNMSLHQSQDLMRSHGEEFTAKLADLIAFAQGEDDEFYLSANELNFRKFRNWHLFH